MIQLTCQAYAEQCVEADAAAIRHYDGQVRYAVSARDNSFLKIFTFKRQ